MGKNAYVDKNELDEVVHKKVNAVSILICCLCCYICVLEGY
jgi:hypothetical protein